MAVDTKHKRMSILNFGSMGALLPPPDGNIDAGDRAMLLGLYSGIPAAPPALPAPVYIGKRGKRSTPMARAHPRQVEWDKQLAQVNERMRNYRQQTDIEARKVAVREEQRQRVLQKQAIKMRAAQMERERRDADEPVTRATVRKVVKQVLKEERDD